MPTESWIQVILALIGSGGLVAWLLNRRAAKEDAQLSREAALQKEIKDGLNERIKDALSASKSVDQIMQVLQAQQQFFQAQQRMLEQLLELVRGGKVSP